MRIGILTSGGDCPGINATIRGIIKTASYYGIEVLGIRNGFKGLLEGDVLLMLDEYIPGLLTMGGTFLGTSRVKPFKCKKPGDEKKPAQMLHTVSELDLDCVVCIGGNGTMKTTYKMQQLGIPVIGIPKTIDNDIWGTDITFGFDTAVSIATEAIDRLHSTALSHRRVMVIEVMGHKAGWIALHAGMAGGADVILIPELQYDIRNVCSAIRERQAQGKASTIVVVAEGLPTDGKQRPAEYLTRQIEKETEVEARYTVLGYVQRGGSPTAFDRNLSTRIGATATELISRKEFGRMIAVQGNEVTSLPLKEVAGRLKLVTEDVPLLMHGRKMGVCFG